MLSYICLVISIISFITVWGCHMMLKNEDPSVEYLSSPLLSSVPWVSGFVLAVIPECLIFNIAWYWMFLINVAGTVILGPVITRFFLARMGSGEGLGVDAVIALAIGAAALIAGLALSS